MRLMPLCKWNIQEVAETIKKTMSNQQTNLSKNLVVSVLCSFGGMEKNNTVFSYVTNGKNETMDIGAERFYDYITNSLMH